MADVVLLSDSLIFGPRGDPRYMAPYALATQLEKNGFDTAVIDYFTRVPDFFRYLENFLGPETLFVGLSSTFLSVQPEERASRDLNLDVYSMGALWFSSGAELECWLDELRALLDRICPAAKIVLGGSKALRLILEGWGKKQIDYFGLSASETSLVELAQSLRISSAPKTFSQYRVTVLDNREALLTKQCPETVLSHKFAIQPGEALPIEVSRGCVFNCKFCYFDKKESTRKPIGILRDEILRNYELFGTTVYSFCDDCFNDFRGKVDEVCGMLLKLPFKVEWISYARLDLAIREPDSLELMIESGARGLFFGVESFNWEVAKRAGKGVPTEKIKAFIENFHHKYRDRCLLELSFIIGLPGETVESQLATEKWLLENPLYDFISIGKLQLSPYSAKLDSAVIDFADYARRPEHYGFREVSPDGKEWSHDTMSSRQAQELLEGFWERKFHGQYSAINHIWRYPVLRSLGFGWSEIARMAREPEKSHEWAELAKVRFADFLERYRADLLRMQPRKTKLA
ncbi:MAG: B12-binding domain-containing radical SAM protein [Bdellovibrionota bacterium]